MDSRALVVLGSKKSRLLANHSLGQLFRKRLAGKIQSDFFGGLLDLPPWLPPTWAPWRIDPWAMQGHDLGLPIALALPPNPAGDDGWYQRQVVALQAPVMTLVPPTSSAPSSPNPRW